MYRSCGSEVVRHKLRMPTPILDLMERLRPRMDLLVLHSRMVEVLPQARQHSVARLQPFRCKARNLRIYQYSPARTLYFQEKALPSMARNTTSIPAPSRMAIMISCLPISTRLLLTVSAMLKRPTAYSLLLLMACILLIA